MKRPAAFFLTAVALCAAGDAAKTRELIALLKSETPLIDRARACQQLALIGTPEAVPAVATLLADTQLGHYARETLEAMASPEADAALRAALGRLQGGQLMGVINSLGARGDAAGVPALMKIAEGVDAAVSAAALGALGRIATPDAIAGVQAELNGPRREIAADAAVVAADRLLARGMSADAVKLFAAVRGSGVAGQARLSAVRGAILARGEGGVPLLLQALRSPEGALRDVALRAMRELSGRGVTAALVAELPRLNPALQPHGIAALADRGGESVLAAIEAQAGPTDPAVRIAALGALGRIGGNSSLPLLLRALAEDGAAGDAGRRSLVQLAAPATDAALLRALSGASTDTQLKLIALIGAIADRRQPCRSSFGLARDPRPEINRAALRALGAVAGPGELPGTHPTRGDAARRRRPHPGGPCDSRRSDENPRARAARGAAARRATGGARAAERAALMRPLGAVVRALGGSTPARDAVLAGAKSSDAAEQGAAVRSLADWPDGDAGHGIAGDRTRQR